MAITHVNTQFGTPTASLSSTSVVTKPTGLAVGDVMIAVVNANKAGISAPSVRWHLIGSNDSVSNLYRQEVWYCVATSSETGAANFTWSDGDANSPMWAAIAAYRGVDQTNPINTSNFNVNTTTNPDTTPSITTTTTALILYIRTIRDSASSSTFSSSITNERFDGKNTGSGGVSYDGAMYDSGSQQAAGSISGTSISRSGGTQTDSITATIALAVADLSVSAGKGAATADANDATVGIGQSVTAGKAAATAAAKQPSALAGKVVNTVGVAACTAAVADTARVAQPSRAAATAAVVPPNLFFGTPSYRLKTVESDTYPVVGLTGIPQRRITVEQE